MSNKTYFLLFIFGPVGLFIALLIIVGMAYLLSNLIWPTFVSSLPIIFFLTMFWGAAVLIGAIYFYFNSVTPTYLLFIDDLWWLLGGLAVVSCFFVILGYAPLREPLRLWIWGVKTTAVIDEKEENSVEYLFEDTYGHTYLGRNRVDQNMYESLRIGASVTIYYDPAIRPEIRPGYPEYTLVGSDSQIEQKLIQTGKARTIPFLTTIIITYGLFFIIGIVSYIKFDPSDLEEIDGTISLPYGEFHD